jgi:hypothetical protein
MAAAVAEQPNDQLKAGTLERSTADLAGTATGILKLSGGFPGTIISTISLPVESINLFVMYLGSIPCVWATTVFVIAQIIIKI